MTQASRPLDVRALEARKKANLPMGKDGQAGVGRLAPALGFQTGEAVHMLNDDLDQLLKAPATALRGTMYATRTLEFPFALTPESPRISTEFGQEINYFAMEISTTRTQEVNNLISTATVRTPFLVTAIAFVMFAEFEQAAIAGTKNVVQVVPPLATGALPTPFYGGQNIPNNIDETRRPATFRHGWDAAEFVAGMNRAYRLQMFLGGDLRYVDELLSNVGTIDSSFYWQGYGDAQRSIADYIRKCNDQMESLGSGDRFLPQTGQFGVQDAQEGVLPPLVDTQCGGAIVGGAYACSFKVRPFVALPGVPIDIQLVRENQETVYYDQVINALSHGGTVTYAREYNENLSNIAGNANVSYACDVQFKYGRLQLGTILLGARITSRCCLDWYFNYGAGLAGIYETGNERTSRTLKNMAKQMGLDDIPTPRSRAGGPILSGLTFPEKKNPAGLAEPPNDEEISDFLRAQGVKVVNPKTFRNENRGPQGQSLYPTQAAKVFE